MGISYKVALWLNTLGHDAIHISEKGLHTLQDELIIEKAVSENRIILTSDVDFGQILAFTQSDSISIIQFRLFDASPQNIISKLTIVFNQFSQELTVTPVIITVQEHKVRVKKLPF